MQKISRRAFLGAVATTALLAGCSSRPRATTATPGTAYPVTIEHAYGSTTIERAPGRVATFGLASHDVCVALGVIPVIMSGSEPRGYKTTIWFDEALAKYAAPLPPRYNPDVALPTRDMADARPDLIIAANAALSKSEYERLSAIAPVVAQPGTKYNTEWRTTTEIVATALGMPDRAQPLLEKTEAAVRKAAEPYAPLDDLTGLVMAARASAGTAYEVFAPETNPSRILAELGPVAPAWLYEDGIQQDASLFVQRDSSSRLQGDLAVLSTPKNDMRSVLSSSARIPAAEDDRGVVVNNADEGAALYEASPLSVAWVAKALIPQLARAAYEFDGRRS